MRQFKDKVAVVTGAASGIGLAIARRFAREHMRLVLADVEVDALAAAEREIRAMGATAIAVSTDVSRMEEVEALAAKTLNAFGSVHILCNNAGVDAPPGPIWERSLEDWQWLIGVNLWGVVHGIRAFVPVMLKQREEAHVVNTASVAGLLSVPFKGLYQATKHAVVTISETLYLELAMSNSGRIGVSVLCPGFVNTRILDSARNRPADLAAPLGELSPAAQEWDSAFRTLVAAGMSPDKVADRVFEAICEEKLYVLTHPELNDHIRQRVEGILAGRNPVFTANRMPEQK